MLRENFQREGKLYRSETLYKERALQKEYEKVKKNLLFSLSIDLTENSLLKIKKNNVFDSVFLCISKMNDNNDKFGKKELGIFCIWYLHYGLVINVYCIL